MDEAEGITLKQALVVAVTFPLDCCLLDVASESDKRHRGKKWSGVVFLLGGLFLLILRRIRTSFSPALLLIFWCIDSDWDIGFHEGQVIRLLFNFEQIKQNLSYIKGTFAVWGALLKDHIWVQRLFW